jgi:hypothetical protein
LFSSTRGTTTTVTVNTDPDIYPTQPWVAIRTYDDEYLRLDTAPTSPGVWTFAYNNRVVDTAVVGVCDLQGNTALEEVRDGTRRITNQSEFYRSHPVNLDLLTRAGEITLEKGDGPSAYVPSGSLVYTFDARWPVHWEGARLQARIPETTSIRARYRFADREDHLEQQPWSSYFDTETLAFDASARGRFVQCEILLESDSTLTPALESFEVIYDPVDLPVPSGVWVF